MMFVEKHDQPTLYCYSSSAVDTSWPSFQIPTTVDALANTNAPGPAIVSVAPGFHMPGAPPASIPLKEFCDVPTKLP